MTDKIFDELATLRLDEQKPLHPTPLDNGWGELVADPDLVMAWDMGPSSAPPDILGLNDDDAAEKMAEWFLTNFENPAENTPWDEGAYVYIWGGPYYAREELEEVFGELTTESAIEAAAEQIEDAEDGSLEWAPASSRMQPEEPPSDLVAAKQRLMIVLRAWRVRAQYHGQLSPTAEFDVRNVATLLRSLYQLQHTTRTGGAHD
jgi:hypothetical protein